MYCQHIISRGINKGTACNKFNCKKHGLQIVQESFVDQYFIDDNDSSNNLEDVITPFVKNNNNDQSILNTVYDIISLRGYNIIKHDNYIGLKMIETDKCLFIFCNHVKLNKNCIRNILKYVMEFKHNHIFLIYSDKVTTGVYKAIKYCCDIEFELFDARSLVCNILNHSLVPSHELVTEKLKESRHFPFILATDPVVKLYNYKKGDILKITRKNGNIAYRIVK